MTICRAKLAALFLFFTAPVLAGTVDVRIGGDGLVAGEFAPKAYSRANLSTAIRSQLCTDERLQFLVLFELRKKTKFKAVCDAGLRLKDGRYRIEVGN